MTDETSIPAAPSATGDEPTVATDTPRTERLAAEAPISAWFLGPKSEHSAAWRELLEHVLQDYLHWRRNYFPMDPLIVGHSLRREQAPWLDGLNEELDKLVSKLKAGVPFFHPRYLAHMTSEATLPSVVGYFAAMLYNANNVTDEAGPATVDLEGEVGEMLATMVGFNPTRSWSHVTSGGTVANVEALWVARQAQFVTLGLRDLCREKRWELSIDDAPGGPAELSELGDVAALQMRPAVALQLPARLARKLVEQDGREPSGVAAELEAGMRQSRWNPGVRGYAEVRADLGRRPLIFAPATAHYSIRKAANLLGYGEEAVRIVPVDSNFRMDVDALREQLLNQGADVYVAGVVAVLGTTEEGAIDPVHEVLDVRDELERNVGASFWLHVDAAWGGYMASMLRGLDLPADTADIRTRSEALASALKIRGEIELSDVKPPLARVGNLPSVRIDWADGKVLGALLRLGEADSITVDPHKLGYVPYPAGYVAFRDRAVTRLMRQEAPYIQAEGVDEGAGKYNVGAFALEGSKPGASAAACWLSHKVIPLTRDGHGDLMRSTIAAAQRLYGYLRLHESIHDQLGGDEEFTFVPFCRPDTNLVCFVARPMARVAGRLVPRDTTLDELNALNRAIHERVGRPPGEIGQSTPYAHPFFVSTSTFKPDVYSPASLTTLLERLRIPVQEYAESKLFYLRSTVMNPHYEQARSGDEGRDYLYEFVLHLHATTESLLPLEPELIRSERNRG
ncbi:MAG: pyridoxal-dependent decarboxylase [Solirubrobacteraceae bacterium]